MKEGGGPRGGQAGPQVVVPAGMRESGGGKAVPGGRGLRGKVPGREDGEDKGPEVERKGLRVTRAQPGASVREGSQHRARWGPWGSEGTGTWGRNLGEFCPEAGVVWLGFVTCRLVDGGDRTGGQQGTGDRAPGAQR